MRVGWPARVPRTVALDVDRVDLRASCVHVLVNAGWLITSADATAGISDGLHGDLQPVRATVILLAPLAAACMRATRLATESPHVGVVCDDELPRLPVALEALVLGMSSVSRRAIALARQTPALTARQAAILGALVRAQSNQEIAAALHVSHATVKRDVAAIAHAFGARSRHSIRRAAIEAGFRIGEESADGHAPPM